ncbi:GDSL esterase/lipase EXL3 [Carex littledalei]|uniref:GDSL esterase/lipase EXL3 n=1 Tax=Carex littledalei TaxID=544730 RepID=A0A833QDD4_9POAL|nr:GDSL esterase/lipase EXL3 [Carex littledalei]
MKLLTASLAFFLLLCSIQHGCHARTKGQSVRKTATKPLAPALITFGDSIIDPGNNNVQSTIIKCNFPPYGRDFVTHRPTGRFCNGRIPTDFIASKLGIKDLLPAYLGTNLTNQDLLTGVSFACGGTGFDLLTAQVAGVLSMPEQLQKFKEYQGKVRTIIGEKKAAELFSQSVYGIIAGSDDVANTYFTTPFRIAQYDYSSYANLMLKGASSFVEQLIQLGARKIAIVGVPPIGCVPSQRTLAGGILRDCASGHNAVARLYNSRLAKEVEKISKKHQNVTLIYADIYDFLYDMIAHPTKYGFEVSNVGCCGTGLLEVSVLCNPLTPTICGNVSNHVFWDSYHPTEKAYSILAEYITQKLIPYLV